MKISLYLKTKARKDGMYLVNIRFNYKAQRYVFSTKEFVRKEYWNAARQMLDSHKMKLHEQQGERSNKILMDKLDIVKRYFKSIIDRGKPFSKDDLQRALEDEMLSMEWQNELSLCEYFEYYEKVMKGKKKPNTLRKGKQVIDSLKQFKPNIDWHDLDHIFWDSYTNFCIEEKKLSANTIERHAIELKLRAKTAIKHFPNIRIPQAVFDFNYEGNRLQKTWLTDQEVQAIAKAHVLTRTQEVIRDQFVLTCYIGLRFSDAEIKKENLFYQKKKPYLRVIITKTQLDYNIPLRKDVLRILEKYDFKIPQYANQTHNDWIKIIAKKKIREIVEEPYYVGTVLHKRKRFRADLITTHTARRTFAREWLDRGGSLEMLSKYLGHKSTKTTLTYIGYTPRELTSEFERLFG